MELFEPMLCFGGGVDGLKVGFAGELLGRLYFSGRLPQVLQTIGATGYVSGVPGLPRIMHPVFCPLEVRHQMSMVAHALPLGGAATAWETSALLRLFALTW